MFHNNPSIFEQSSNLPKTGEKLGFYLGFLFSCFSTIFLTTTFVYHSKLIPSMYTNISYEFTKFRASIICGFGFMVESIIERRVNVTKY